MPTKEKISETNLGPIDVPIGVAGDKIAMRPNGADLVYRVERTDDSIKYTLTIKPRR